jgi:deoxycytidylate deaminase
VVVGTNEVVKAFGGQYWDGDSDDARDHKRTSDSNTSIANDILVDLLARLRKGGWLAPEKSMPDVASLLQMARNELLGPMDATDLDPPSLAESAYIRHLIEFIRAVHAEMAALMSAAQRGVAVDGCTLYSTSFPCHECARHIVAAGIRRVVFIEPYPKSRVAALYDDSICIDDTKTGKVPFHAFIGIAPRLYMSVFAMSSRKADDGQWIDWDRIRCRQSPRYHESSDAYINKEENGIMLLTPFFNTEVTS